MRRRIEPGKAFLLFLCAFIWGTAFVAQSVGNRYMGPITFQTARSVFAVAVLAPLVLVRRHFRARRKAQGDVRVFSYSRRETLLGGAVCGALLSAASVLQQIALIHTDVGKSGFITALYIVLVPVLWFLLGRGGSVRIWISVLIAVAGLYLLCMSAGFSGISAGDVLLLGCALLFSFQILSVDRFSAETDGVELSLSQFVFATLFSAALCLLFEKPSAKELMTGLFPVIYAGVFSSGVAYTLQIVGQKGSDPAICSLIMSLESVISVLAGWVLLGQRLRLREIGGCLLMFAAIVLAQLPDREQRAEEPCEKSR